MNEEVKNSIVHVVRQFYPLIGGLENYVYNLAVQQVSRGFKVKVITLNRSFTDNKILPAIEMHGNIEIIRIPYWGSSRYPIALSVLKHCRDCEIIHVHAVDFFADYISFTKKLHSKKLILTTHGGFFHTNKNSGLKKIYFNTVTRYTLKNYQHIIACSSSDYELFSKISDKVQLVHNGVNVSNYLDIPKKVDKGTLLTVGRIDVHKGIDKLIRLIGRFREKGVFLRLEIIGPDHRKLTPELMKLAQNLHVNDRVFFRGKVSERDLKEAYSKAHFFVSASEYEGFGIVAVEALASGTPCILNKIPSFEEILDSQNIGILVDFNNTDEAATQIMKLLFMDDRKYQALSQQARIHAQKFNWKNTARKIEDIYGIPQKQKVLIEA